MLISFMPFFSLLCQYLCQFLFLLIALDDLSDNYNLIATMWEFIQSLVHRPFPEIMTSKFVNLCQLLTKPEVTVSGHKLKGSNLIAIVLSNYSNKSGSK